MKKIRAWRIVEQPFGAFCFFDPSNEKIFIRDLTRFERAAMITDVSVSASTETEKLALEYQLKFPEGVPYDF